MRLGNEHVMGVYLIWKFAKNKEAARKYLVDQQLGYREHFLRSLFYNFPAWTGAIKGGFKEIRRLSAQDAHKPRGKYTVLTTIAEKYTTNPGHPGNTTPVMDEPTTPSSSRRCSRRSPRGRRPPKRRCPRSRRRLRASTASGGTRGSSSPGLAGSGREGPGSRALAGYAAVFVAWASSRRSRARASWST